jgi:hypothetical protein
MNNFENQLDEIRIQLYEDTKMLYKDDIIKTVNSNAKKIAHEFGINIEDPHTMADEQRLTSNSPNNYPLRAG